MATRRQRHKNEAAMDIQRTRLRDVSQDLVMNIFDGHGEASVMNIREQSIVYSFIYAYSVLAVELI